MKKQITFIPEYIAQFMGALHYFACQIDITAAFHIQVCGTNYCGLKFCKKEKKNEKKDELCKVLKQHNSHVRGTFF